MVKEVFFFLPAPFLSSSVKARSAFVELDQREDEYERFSTGGGDVDLIFHMYARGLIRY